MGRGVVVQSSGETPDDQLGGAGHEQRGGSPPGLRGGLHDGDNALSDTAPAQAPTQPPLPTLPPASSRYLHSLLPTPSPASVLSSPRPSTSRQPLINHLQTPSSSSQVLPPTETQVSCLQYLRPYKTNLKIVQLGLGLS